MRHELRSEIQSRDAAEPVAGAGECALAVVEGVSEDRAWPPFHSHPWDEVTFVVEGTMEFRVGDERGTGGPGTVVSLPRGVPHTLRVPEGTARSLMVTVGAPSVAFLREVGEADADGPTLDRLVEIAGRHGVVPVPG